MHSARSPFSPDVFGLPSEPIALLDLALSAGLVAGGVGHTLLTPVIYGHESGLNRAWFAGAGLALAYMGMLNIARAQGGGRLARSLSRAANPAGAAFMGLAAARGGGPIAALGCALCAAQTAVAMRRHEGGSL